MVSAVEDHSLPPAASVRSDHSEELRHGSAAACGTARTMTWIDGLLNQQWPQEPPLPLSNDDSSGGLLKCVGAIFQCECHDSENAVRQLIGLCGSASLETVLQVI